MGAIFFQSHPYIWSTTVLHDYQLWLRVTGCWLVEGIDGMLEAGLLAEGGGLDSAGEVHFFVEGVEDATLLA